MVGGIILAYIRFRTEAVPGLFVRCRAVFAHPGVTFRWEGHAGPTTGGYPARGAAASAPPHHVARRAERSPTHAARGQRESAAMTTLHELDKYVRSQKVDRGRKDEPSKHENGNKGTVVAKSLSRTD